MTPDNATRKEPLHGVYYTLTRTPSYDETRSTVHVVWADATGGRARSMSDRGKPERLAAAAEAGAEAGVS